MHVIQKVGEQAVVGSVLALTAEAQVRVAHAGVLDEVHSQH
jgi:hypothetical protein